MGMKAGAGGVGWWLEKVSRNLKQEGQAVWAGAGNEKVQHSPGPSSASK